MSIKSRTFEWSEGGQKGSRGRAGWKLLDSGPDTAAGRGLIVAHDVLEHVVKGEAFKNELIAFGCTMFGRMIGGNTEVQIVASASDLSEFLTQQRYIIEKPSIYASRLKLDQFAEFILFRFMQKTAILSKPGSDHSSGFYLTSESNYLSSQSFLDKEKDIRAWIRLGYKIAQRQYKDSAAMYKLFVEIGEKVNTDHDLNYPHFGDRLTIAIDLADLSVKLTRCKEAEYA